MNRVMRKPAFEYASSVAVQSGLCQAWSKTPKICFLRTRRIHILVSGMGVILPFLTTCIMNLVSTDLSRVVRKPAFCICENKDADQLRGNRDADQRLCFRYIDSQSLYFLYTKFQASCHLLCLYSLVCVGPGWKPRRPVFSQRGSFHVCRVKEKSCCWVFQPGSKQTWLYYLHSKNKGANLRVIAQLICIIVFVYIKCRSSLDQARI